MHKRTLLTWMLAAPLAGCGYRLRGAQTYAFRTIFLSAARGSPLALELERTLQAGTDTLQVLRAPLPADNAEAVFELLTEQHGRAVVSQNASGQVRELQLSLRVRFRVRNAAGTLLIDDTELLQTRDMSYSETQALAKESEEALLYRNMQTEIVQQIVRRLGAIGAS